MPRTPCGAGELHDSAAERGDGMEFENALRRRCSRGLAVAVLGAQQKVFTWSVDTDAAWAWFVEERSVAYQGVVTNLIRQGMR